MITMQQLEELESRIIKALKLIGDLRAENAKLEADNESLKVQAEEARLSLEEKEQEIARLKKEVENATNELAKIKQKEEVLEKKIIEMLAKLDTLQQGRTYETKQSPVQSQSEVAQVEHKEEKKYEEAIGDEEDIIIIDDTIQEKGNVEVDTLPAEEDEIVLLDDADEEIVIDDVDEDMVIVDENSKDKSSTNDKISGDDDFIIIEDDEK